MNARGLRAPLKKGDVTIGDVIKIMPFDNVLYALLLNGETVDELFQFLSVRNGDGLAGATCDLTPEGMKNIRINGEELNKDGFYWVFVSNYLAEGGDRYFVLRNYEKKIESNLLIKELIVEYIQELTDKNMKIDYVHNVRINVISD